MFASSTETALVVILFETSLLEFNVTSSCSSGIKVTCWLFVSSKCIEELTKRPALLLLLLELNDIGLVLFFSNPPANEYSQAGGLQIQDRH